MPDSQRGLAPIILILLAAVGIIIYLLLTNTASFKDKLFSKLYPKPSSYAQEAPPSVPDEVIVKFKPGVDERSKDNIRRAHGLNKIDEVKQIEVERNRVPEKAKDKIIEALNKNPNIEYAEPDILYQLQDTPNDPIFTSGPQLELQKVAAPAAWDISKGNSGVIVAVLDSGLYAEHEDIVGKVVPGYNYIDNNTDTSDKDISGHGTWVSGIVAAATNNGKGTASLGRNIKIMPFQICSSTGGCSSYAAAQGIIYAVDHGAKVANMSWGSTVKNTTLQKAINDVWGKGMVIVAAAGNYNNSPVLYPAGGENIIAIGGTTAKDEYANYNYGSGLDVMAPGVGVHSITKAGGYALFSGSSASSPMVAGLAALIFSANPNLTPQQVVDIILQTADKAGGYSYDDMSINNCNGWNQYMGCGRINAAAALQKAANTVPEPTPTPIPTPTPTPTPVTEIINPILNITEPANGSNVSGNVNILAAASDNVAISSVSIFIDGSVVTSCTTSSCSYSWDTTQVANGSHAIQAKALDSSSNLGESSLVTIDVNNGSASTPTPDPTPTPITSDITKPTISIINPLNNTTVKPNSKLTIQAQASDNIGISKVEFYVNGGTPKCTSTLNITTYSCPWNVPGRKGATYTIEIKVSDLSNNVNSAISKVTAK